MNNYDENVNTMSPFPEPQITPLRKLSFADLRLANVPRCEEAFHPLHAWSPSDWATALAGECGEACNLIKKMRRGEMISTGQIAKELADVVIYADLLAARLNIDLGAAVMDKFNEVSDRTKPLSKIHLGITE